MRIKCLACGKKYDESYTHCPECGRAHDGDGSTNVMYSGLNETVTGEAYESQSSYKKTTVHSEGNNANYYGTKSSGGRKAAGIIGIVLFVIVAVLIFGGGMYFNMPRAEKGEPEVVVLGRVTHEPKELFETIHFNLRVDEAEVLKDEWLTGYLPEQKQIVGVQILVQQREDKVNRHYSSKMYVEYKDGCYAQEISDYRLLKALETDGYRTIESYDMDYRDTDGIMFFLVDADATEVTLCYTERPETKSGTYEVRDTHEVVLKLE